MYAVLIVVLCGFSYLAWVSYQTIDRELTQSEYARRQALARSGAALLEEKFKRLTDIGVALATRVRFRKHIVAGEWGQAIQILGRVPSDFASIERVFLTDPDGTEMAATPALEGGVGKNFAYRDWYQGVAKDWQPYISHVYERVAIPKRNLFAVAAPIKHNDGRLLGILVLQIRLQEFFAWTEGLNMGAGSQVYVVDSRGGLAYHPEHATQQGIKDYSSVPVVKKVLAGQSDIEISSNPYEDSKQLSAYEPVKYGWGFVIQQPARVAFADEYSQLKAIFIGYSLFLIFIALITLLIVKILKQRMKVQEDRRINQELEEQWSFFRKVIDIDRNMIFVKDVDGRFILVNQAVADVFGTTKADMLGKTNSDFIQDKDLVEKFAGDEREVIETQKEKIIPEIRIRDTNGNTRWLQVVMRPLTSIDGNKIMVLGVSSDITERIAMESELRHNVDRFELISHATNDAVWDWNFEEGSLWWNQSFKTLFGYDENDGIGDINFWENHIHPADREGVINGIEAVINSGDQHWQDEYRFLRKDGSYAHVHDHGYIVRDDQGNAYRMLGSMTDISDRYEQEAKIERLSRIRNILSEINYAIVRARDRELLLQEACRICVDHGGFKFAWVSLLDDDSRDISPVALYGDSRGYLETVEFSANPDNAGGESLTGMAVRTQKTLISNDVSNDENVIYQEELLKRGFKSMVAMPMVVQEKAIGSLSLYSDETNIFDTEEIELLNELVADVTFALEYLDKEDKVRFLAYYDSLTGLSNRDLFLDRVDQYLQSAVDKSSAVLLIDIERFAYINEVYGHHVGDNLLKHFSALLKSQMTDEAHIARLASNTFAMLLTGIKDASAAAWFIEQKLLARLDKHIQVENTEMKVSIRVGVAMSPMDGERAEALLKNAEAALKSAKQSGDKYLFYTRDMNAQVAEKLALENKLKEALENAEFVLHYQPKIDVASRQLRGLEALIRWHSDEGIIPPDKFIPVLEETGFILDVGKWVLQQAIRDYSAWREQGLQPPPIAVNISPIQLNQKDFVEQIDQIFEQSGGDYKGLELEITETVIMEDLEQKIAILRDIRQRNIGISIDDFGTGYSSLRYMSQLPVTSLKIDRLFISNLLANDYDAAIVATLIPLAHSLGLKVIAEGVENEKQAHRLQELACDEFQGYLFSAALPAGEVETLLRNHRAAN